MEATLRRQAEGYLGTAIEPSEWDKAISYAEHKLAYIIENFGDLGGERRKPYYLAQLIAETVRGNRLSTFLRDLNELREMGIKKDSPCPKTQGRPVTSPYCSTAVQKMQ